MKHISSYNKIFEGGKYTEMYEVICDLDFFCKDLTDQGFTYRMHPDPHIWNIEKMVDHKTKGTALPFAFWMDIQREEEFLLEDVIDDMLLMANFMKKNGWDSLIAMPNSRGNDYVPLADTRKFDISKKSDVDDIVDKASVITRKIDSIRIRFI